MTFIPSPQQAALFDWIKNGSGNAFVQAVAGAGKTTSIMEGSAHMKGFVAMVAYNKKIAVELQEKVAKKGLGYVTAGTFHSFAYKTWIKRCAGKYLKLDGYKVRNLVENDPMIEEGYQAFVSSLVSLAKQRALGSKNPNDAPRIEDRDAWLDIVDHHSLDTDLDEGCKVMVGIEHAIRVLQRSNSLGDEIIDFDDQIYLPVLHGAKPSFVFDWVLVDEAQDTNPCRRIFAKSLVKRNGRMIFVGDKHQAIYGFTGADAAAVDMIIDEFDCKELPLTVTYRCPKKVVEASQKYVSHIQAHETAKDGEVRDITREDFEKEYATLRADDAVLCRKTAPLVELAYKLIRKGIACHVEGRDIGANLVKMITKWKKIKRVDAYLVKLEDWETKQVARAVAKRKDLLVDSIKDQCETIRVICEGCETIDEVKAKIQKLFADSDDTNGKAPKNLTLSTVHKAKGREWHRVFVLGFKEYMPSKMAKLDWEREQETNLIYVAFTRAQETLTLVG